jgi:hypothetical protein
LVERSPEKAGVGGSIPSLATTFSITRAGLVPFGSKTKPGTPGLVSNGHSRHPAWFAPHNIQGGKKIHEQIDEAIRVYDRLLLILSENSMSSSAQGFLGRIA